MKKFIGIGMLTFIFACGAKVDNKSVENNIKSTDSLSTPQTTVLDAGRPSPWKQTVGMVDGAKVTVMWGSPSVKGREIWGMLVPYDEVWRTGANETTSLEVDKDILVEGKELKAGKYGIYSIPKEDGSWTVIFNTVWNAWGSFEYDEKKDALRVDVKKEDLKDVSETLEFELEKDGVGFKWEKVKVKFSVKSKTAA